MEETPNTNTNTAVSNELALNTVGQVTFRMLCHIDAAGGLIGKSGKIITKLESDTGTRIRVSKAMPTCLERVISIAGQAAFNRRITLDDGEEYLDVSEAQEALLRVYERVLEVEGGGGRVVGCRLLAHVSQIGAVLGKGGKIVANICKVTGAQVKVLPQNQLPPCADHEDVPIQLMGKTLAVKKALVCVSSRLQDKSPTEILAGHTPFHENAKFVLPWRPLTAPSHGYSEGIQKTHNLEKEDYGKKVVFRLLCLNDIVGGVIGTGGTLIKALETETGASIKILAPVGGSSERVAIISAPEEPGSVSSAAQIALIRVFTRCVDVGIERGIIKGSGKRKITTRILVASNQIDCLVDEVGNIASEITAGSNVEIQLLAGDLIPNCASKNDNVVQIFGSYENVKSSLLQLTSRIRENILSNMISGGIDKTLTAKFKQLSVPSRFDHGTPTEGILNNPRKATTPHSPWLQSLQTINGEPADMTKYGHGSENQSLEPAQTKTTTEVVVSEQVFSSVCGKNGNNLHCIRQISGAKLEVQEPCPGKSYGKVIITGTLERIQVAKSLLQAFIQSGE